MVEHPASPKLFSENSPSLGQSAGMILFHMQDAKHHHAIPLDEVEDFVGKPSRQQPSELAVVERPSFRFLLQRTNGPPHRGHQFIAQALAPLFVSLAGLPQILLGARADEDAPFHCGDGPRRRASTSSHEEPASGFFR